jgi:hypothetical protein
MAANVVLSFNQITFRNGLVIPPLATLLGFSGLEKGLDYSQGSTMLYRSTPATHARFHAGGICFRFLGSSALSIARLAAVIAPSLLSDVPDFVPVPVSTDHFQRPRWIPWIIRYSTPRCSMLSLPPRRAWSILLRWVRLCWRPSVRTFDKFE